YLHASVAANPNYTSEHYFLRRSASRVEHYSGDWARRHHLCRQSGPWQRRIIRSRWRPRVVRCSRESQPDTEVGNLALSHLPRWLRSLDSDCHCPLSLESTV